MIVSELVAEPSAPRNDNSIRPLSGKLTTQYVTCGKADCRCRNGQLHGPYHYRVWRDGDQIKKEYVKRTDIERVRNSCQAFQDMMGSIMRLRAERRRLSRRIKQSLRKTTKIIRRPL